MFKYSLQFNRPSKYERMAWNIHCEKFTLSEPVNKNNLLQAVSEAIKDQIKDMVWMTSFNKPNQHKQFMIPCKDEGCSCVVTMVE